MGVSEAISNGPVLRAPGPIAPGRVAVVTGAASGIGLGLAERFDELSALGASPAEVAAMVVDGIRSERFYILTSDNGHGAVLRRREQIMAGGPPTAPVDFA